MNSIGARLVRDAKAAAEKFGGISPEQVLYFWIYEAIERGLLTEEELEEMGVVEAFVFLEEQRDAALTSGVVGKLKGAGEG